MAKKRPKVVQIGDDDHTADPRNRTRKRKCLAQNKNGMLNLNLQKLTYQTMFLLVLQKCIPNTKVEKYITLVKIYNELSYRTWTSILSLIRGAS